MGQDNVKQTVPTRTPTPEPVVPTSPPPTAVDTPAPPPPTEAPPLPTPTVAPTATAVLALLTANADAAVRSGPGLDYDVLGVLEEGAASIVVGRSADSSWWQIVFNQSYGWVSDADVTVDSAAYYVPIANVASTEADNSSPAMLPQAGRGSWALAPAALLLMIGALLLLTGMRRHLRQS